MNDLNRGFGATCGVLAAVVVVPTLLCGGCLFLGILVKQRTDAAQAKAREPLVAAAKAAISDHFNGDVEIVAASIDRPANPGWQVIGQYRRPDDRPRDFLATVDQIDGQCHVLFLILDGQVVIEKP